MDLRRRNLFAVLVLISLAGLLAGCAGRVFAPKNTIWYYHQELPAADKAVEAARAAGKDKECPKEFQAAEKMKNDAYNIYYACRTQEAIAMANEAAAKANALCPKMVEAPKPAPVAPPPPPPAPTVSLMASPATIEKGKCANLTWSSANASSASIDQAIGSVGMSGSREVCPESTTQYTITAMGEGGSRTAASTVNVVPPPPPAAPPPIDKLTIRVNFNVDKAQIRNEDLAELNKAVAFVKKYPGHKVSVEGHTDSTGSERYNHALSEKRAEAVKKYLLDNAATEADKIKTAGFGETKPIADNKTAKGRFENRRVEILIFSR